MQHFKYASVTPPLLIMPSHRKRIGFLPSEEIHEIIEKICISNNFSQSKVTGILVEEALMNRGIIKNSFFEKPLNINVIRKDLNNSEQDLLNNAPSKNVNLSNKETKDTSEDLKMINDFIEYKFFKKIMNEYNKVE